MVANPDKFQIMFIGLKESKRYCLHINGNIIVNTDTVKLLGVTIDSKLNFRDHVTHVCKKMNQKTGAFSRIARYLDVDKAKILYHAFIPSNFNYCPLIWMFCGKTANNTINRLHKRTLRVLYGDYDASFEDLLRRSGEPTIRCKNLQKLMLEIYKCINAACPSFMSQFFTPKDIQYDLRTNILLQLPGTNTLVYGNNSLSFRGTILWNTLPGTIKAAQNTKLLNSFSVFLFLHWVFNMLHTSCAMVGFRTILLSDDIESNPVPETLDFCTWNLNSITAHDFLRVSLVEAYNSIYNHDLIGVVETHLDSTIDEERLALDGYSFHKDNHPQNVKRGGVGLYAKDSLPSKDRPDFVTLSECVVCEIQLKRKKYFFVVVYRSPSQNQAEFDNLLLNFELLLSKIQAENPFCVVITGDFNCRSTQWWAKDIENSEGKEFEPLTSDLGLHQLISEPTHLMGGSQSCIDLIFTDQPNLVVESGVHLDLPQVCFVICNKSA